MSNVVLISGGCGFIGVNLGIYLLNLLDCTVRILDNLSVGRKEYLDEALNDLGIKERVELIKGDIRDKNICVEACKDIDTVIHLAAHTGVIPSIEDPFFDFETNILGTLHLLDAAVKNRVKKFIFASSNATVGNQPPPLNEAKLPKPLSPYGASKLAGEGYCSAFYGSYGLKTVSLRFANVYGPSSLHKSSVVSKFIKDALLYDKLTVYGDGTQTRDFIHVDDLCQAISRIIRADADEMWGGVFHLGTGKETRIIDLARLIVTLFDNEIKIDFEPERRGEIKRNYSDASRAQETFGFRPMIRLEDGVKRVYEWFLEKGIGNIRKAKVLSGSE